MAPATLRALAAAICLIVTAMPVTAQEVHWRTDYEVARREARETGRPLVIDFGTAACVWCKRLDADTFRDPSVVRSLNEQFIPVKLDASRHPALVQSLQIHGFPALVFATPDSKILDTHEGFLDAGQFSRQLARTIEASGARPSAGAKQLLARARDDFRDGLYQGCREKCAALTTNYAASPEAAEAKTLVARIQNDDARADRPKSAPTFRGQSQ
jgi:thioredoxin-like negative regulator of GroEL